MKQLARVADERWASKPSYLDRPAQQQPVPATMPRDRGGYVPPSEPAGIQGVRNAVEGPEKQRESEEEPNPYHRSRGGPSEGWQPNAWTPGAAKR